MRIGDKDAVRDFWEEASCGERLYLPDQTIEGYRAQAEARYRLEPYIEPFARFEAARGLRVLEIGVGLGADHERFATAGAHLTGIDLTPRAVSRTRARLEVLGLPHDVREGDAERIDFPDNTFDVVYSWGVIHHSPDTPQAVREILRVLKPGGQARVMIYHRYSLIGLMLWLRYGLGTGRPFMSLTEVYATHLESPGTKAYTRAEALAMFSGFSNVQISIELTHGDLLTSEAGQRHQGGALSAAKALWPRWLLRRVASGFGLFMLIQATKPT